MSKTIEVIYSATFEVIGNDGRSEWKKVGSKEIPEEGETVESIWDAMDKKAHAWHKKTYPELYSGKGKKPVIDKTKTEPDIIILKKYDNACKSSDEKTKLEIEANYNI